jgi:hypothetical protein
MEFFRVHSSLDSEAVWNRLKTRFFLLHPAAALNIDGAASPEGMRVFHDCLFLQRP